MYKLEIKLEGLPRIITNGSQGSWRGMHFNKKRWSNKVQFESYPLRPVVPLSKCKVEATRFSTTRPDRDNLAASFKPLLDGLVKCGVLEDDSDDVIVEMKYAWEKAGRGKGFITLVVEEVA